jgi:hypothetical protein
MTTLDYRSTFLFSALSRGIDVWTHALSPVEAEVRALLRVSRQEPPWELRGRLTGPRCRYATTVEVAYPFRDLPCGQNEPQAVSVRALIPEPSLWEPTCPFLYEGPLEVWQGNRFLHRRPIRHGLRTVQIGPRGLRWNGQPLSLRGVARDEFGEEDALRLRQAGVNLLLASAPASPSFAEGVAETQRAVLDLYSAADLLGALVLARAPHRHKDMVYAADWCQHPSCLGWLLSQDRLDDPPYLGAALAQLGGHRGQLLGVELTRPPASQLPQAIAFVAVGEHLLSDLDSIPLPKLLLVPPGRPGALAARPGLLGWVEV